MAKCEWCCGSIKTFAYEKHGKVFCTVACETLWEKYQQQHPAFAEVQLELDLAPLIFDNELDACRCRKCTVPP